MSRNTTVSGPRGHEFSLPHSSGCTDILPYCVVLTREFAVAMLLSPVVLVALSPVCLSLMNVPLILDLVHQLHIKTFYIVTVRPVFVFNVNMLLLKSISQQRVTVSSLPLSQIERVTRKVSDRKAMVLLDIPESAVSVSVQHIMNENNGTHPHLSRFVWVMFVDLNGTEDAWNVPYNCQFIAVSSDDTLTEVYSLKNNTLRFKYGQWERDSGLQTSSLTLFQRRNNLRGIPLHLAVSANNDNTTSDCKFFWSSCEMTIFWTDFQSTLNFSSQVDNDLISTSDASSVLLPISYLLVDGMTDFNFVYPFLTHRLNMYVRVYGADGNADSLTEPFSWEVWATLLVWTAAASACILLIGGYMVCSGKRTQLRLGFTDLLFAALDTLSNQCGYRMPNIISFRIFCLTGRALAAVLVPAYGAALISFLSIRITRIPFVDLQSFERDGTYKIGADVLSKADWYFYSIVNYSVYKRYLDDEVNIDFMKKMCTEKFVLIGLDDDVPRNKPGCPYSRLPQPAGYITTFMPLTGSGTYLKKIFSPILIKYQSSGLMKRIESKLWSVPEVIQAPPAPVEIQHIAILLALFFSACLLAAAMLLLEYLASSIQVVF